MNSCAKFGRLLRGGTIKILTGNFQRIPRTVICNQMSSASASISEYKKEMETFQDVYPTVIEAVSKNYGLVQNPEVTTWLKRVLEYNLHGGKKARGMTAIFAYETLEQPEKLTEESLRLIRVLGWCVEMLQAYFLIMDDIMDGSETRRGAPCWYRRPDVGLGAVNDCNLLQAAMYEVLKVYCGQLSSYHDIVHLFNETLFNTAIGQHLDFTMSHRSKNDYSLFTPERYAAIVKYKTAYYTYKMPVFLGMLVANNMPKETYDMAEKICLDLGYLFQMQDDFLDCFSPEQITGKKGTDIQEGKCSWLAVEALQRLTPAQSKVFVACYGSHEPAHVERIKRLYEELQLPQLYRQMEKQRHDDIIKRTQQLPTNAGAMPELFMKLLSMIYDRKK